MLVDEFLLDKELDDTHAEAFGHLQNFLSYYVIKKVLQQKQKNNGTAVKFKSPT